MAAHDSSLLDIYFGRGLDVRGRRIIFHGGVGLSDDYGESPVETAIKSLLYLDKTTGGIELWLNTSGGDVTEMWGLFDMIRTRNNVITTIGFGEIASAGCLLLAAGDRRKLMPNCWMMWHGQKAKEKGTIDELRPRMRAWERQVKRWTEEMGRLTKRPAEWWAERMTGETHLSPRQLVQCGVVDEILAEIPQ